MHDISEAAPRWRWLPCSRASPTHAQDAAALNAEAAQNDWLTYHGTYKSWHYSALDQINTGNVKQAARWPGSHFRSRANRGLQSTPLAVDGVLYYSGPYNQVYALDGATGQVALDLQAEARTRTWSPGRRTRPTTAASPLGYGNIYIGTLDGKLVAIDMKTGKLNWETKLIDSEKLTVGFTGAPLLVKDKVIIGAQGGEWPYRGPIFGVDAKTGEKVWEFFTVGGNEGTGDARDTWGDDSWQTGGGGGWMAGAYDPETNSVWWGTANPAPLYDWAGRQLEDRRSAPGRQPLHDLGHRCSIPTPASSKAYHQELPHDAWDFDSRRGRVHVHRARRQEIRRAPEQGRLHVRLRPQRQGRERLRRLVNNINFVKDIEPKTGELIGRRDLAEGKHTNLCPAIAGGSAGTRAPTTRRPGCIYRVGYEWCMDLDVVKTEPITEPVVQLNIGANFN